MSIRMKLCVLIVVSLLADVSLRADPPKAEPAPPQPIDRAADSFRLVNIGPKAEPAQPQPIDRAAALIQIQIDTTVWDIDHAKLRALAKSDLGVHEFYKTNGLIKQPDWISAAIGDAVGDLLSPHGRKAVAPKPLPLRAVAVRRNTVSMTLLGHDITSACKKMAEPSLVVTSGREASLLSGGEIPILNPRTGDPEVVSWLEFGLKLKVLTQLLDNRRIALALDFTDSERSEPSVEAGDSSVSLVHNRGFQLSARMKLGECLLVAQQTGKQETTRLVEIQPTLHTSQTVAESPNGKTSAAPNSTIQPVAATELQEPARRMGTLARPPDAPISESLKVEETGKSAHPPIRIQQAADKAWKVNDQLRQLHDEMRELRQEVRDLTERLDREQAALQLQPAVVGITENKQRIARQLDTVVELDINKLPLAKFIDHMARMADINIVLDKPGLDEAEVTAETPIDLNVSGVKLRSALTLALYPLDLGYVIDGEVLKVTSYERTCDAMIPVTYSLADLLAPMTPIHVRIKNGQAEAAKAPASTKNGTISWEQVRDLITSTVAPNSWQEVGGGGQMKFNDSTLSLVVWQTQAAHDELRSLFEQLRTLNHQQVSLELRLIKLNENFHGFGFDLPAGWTQLAPDEFQPLNTDQSAAWVKAASGSNRASFLGLPKVTLLSGQPVNIDVNEESFSTPLHICGVAVASADRQLVRLHLATNRSDRTTQHDGVTAIVRDGQSLLLNITDAAVTDKKQGVPVHQKVPNQARLFKNVSAASSLKPGESLFLLATPRVIATEPEEDLLGIPR